MRFLEMLIALVLSYLLGTYSKDKAKSQSVCFIQRICAQHKPTIMYSTSTVDKLPNFASYYAMKQVSVLRNDMCH